MWWIEESDLRFPNLYNLQLQYVKKKLDEHFWLAPWI